MQYKVYTKNRVIKYPVVFKCEHCGKIIESEDTVWEKKIS